MPVLMSQKDYAVHRGVGPSAVSNWKKANLLVFAPDPENPQRQLIDVEKSDLVVKGKIDPTRGRPRTADRQAVDAEAAAPAEAPRASAARGMSELEVERLAGMRESNRGKRIDNDVRLGSLVPLVEYERRASEFGRRCREGVQAIFRQHAERLAAESEPRVIVAFLTDATDQLFSRLADQLEAEANREREVDHELAPLAEDEDQEPGEDAA